MSNRVDFFQSDYSKLVLPAAKVLVLLDGMACSYLEPIEIVRDGGGSFSWARFVYHPTLDSDKDFEAVEDIERLLPVGKDICVRQIYNGGVLGAGVYSFTVFTGQIEIIKTSSGPKGQRVEVISKDFSSSLSRVTVYGRRVAGANGGSLFLSDIDTIFNENRKPNATIETIESNGNMITVFCGRTTESKMWSCAEVLNYLLCEYLPVGYCARPTIEKLRALTEGKIVRDLNVTSLSLLEALKRCCERVGLKFKFVPRQVDTGPKQAIVFYQPGKGRSVELSCQRKGDRFSVSRTNVAEFKSSRNFWPITRKYIGQGDFKCYEATFDLVKGWDLADQSSDYDMFCPSSNEEFYKVKDVYRKWCLNEAGDYSSEPFSQGEAFDFTKIFGNSNFAMHQRRFYPALTADKQNKSLGYYLQVSVDDGQSWRQYLYSFNNLLDECGVWLSSNQVDFDIWAAALEDKLRFRITAVVVSDERLSCQVADGPTGSCVPVVEHILTVPSQFKYRKVCAESIFFGSKGALLGDAYEIDDSEALFEFVRQEAKVKPETIENIEVKTPSLMFDYQPGDKVTSSYNSRDIFKCQSDSRAVSWIEKVHIDFEKQCTNLKIVRQRGQN